MALLATTVGLSGVALAQEPGVSASVPLLTSGDIVLDGQLDDWSNIEAIVTVGGPQASPDPGANGRFRWQVAADQSTIYFAATITDEVIVAGQNGENYWNEDSFEFYLNLSGNMAAAQYGPGVSQIRIAAVDIGNTDADALTLTGNGVDQHQVSGSVFATEDGWGAEIAVDISGIAEPAAGGRFGLQAQANGSSGGDRDLKVSWSARDTEDTSFEDPGVFAQGVFVSSLAADQSTAQQDDETAAPTVAPANAPTEVESIVDGGPEIITGEEQQRSLFIAGIASAIAVGLGGFLFDRKRKADEARFASDRKVITTPPPDSAIRGELAAPVSDDEEFEALMKSILDDDAPTDGA